MILQRKSASEKDGRRSSIRGFCYFLVQRSIGEIIIKAFKLWRREGIQGVRQALAEASYLQLSYSDWVKIYDSLTPTDKALINKHIPTLSQFPCISILMPVYNTPEKWLRLAIESVLNQCYSTWELCIADDASTKPHVHRILKEYAQRDSRIKIILRTKNGHISAASNSALELANGEFVALLDHDDELSADALYMVAVALNAKPYLDLIYSDEDKIDGKGRRFAPYFKPDWNPDIFIGQNMINHLCVYRTTLVRSIGGFRQGYEGCQDWDLALRASESLPASHIHHIPHVLYHWRAIGESTATTVCKKPYALQTAEAVLDDHLKRTGRYGKISSVKDMFFRIRYPVPTPSPYVSIIIPTRNGISLLRRCVESLQNRTQYQYYEILIVDNQSDDPETLSYLNQIEATGIAKILRYDAEFNYSAINNFAVKATRGSYLCLMNNDIEVISENWLEEMVAQAARPGVGAVGAKLYYPNDTIQHAGVILGLGGVAGHAYCGAPRQSNGYMWRLCLIQNVSAVTAACMVVRKTLYDEVGGLNEENLPVAYNDVDFCLKLLERGYRNLWTPFAELYHHESATRGPEDTAEKQKRFQKEIAYMHSRWGGMLASDPAHNPNLTLKNAWPYFAPPRVVKPWQQ